METLILVLHILIGKSPEGQKLDKIQSVILVNAYEMKFVNKNSMNLVGQFSYISVPIIFLEIYFVHSYIVIINFYETF